MRSLSCARTGAAVMSSTPNAATTIADERAMRRGGETVTPRSLDGVGLRAARLAGAIQRLLQHVPGEYRAFDADRVLHDPLQRHEVAEGLLVGIDLAGHHAAEPARHRTGLIDARAGHGLGHHRRARLADRAPGALEG